MTSAGISGLMEQQAWLAVRIRNIRRHQPHDSVDCDFCVEKWLVEGTDYEAGSADQTIWLQRDPNIVMTAWNCEVVEICDECLEAIPDLAETAAIEARRLRLPA